MKEEQTLSQEQYNKLYDILEHHLSPGDIRILIFKTFGPNQYENLQGNTHTDTVLNCLDRVKQLSKEKTCVDRLHALRPDIDLEEFGVQSEASDDSALPVPFLNFENRKVEWEKVVLYPTGSYYLFDGPLGFGKTVLLKHIRAEFKRRKWAQTCILLSQTGTPFQVITHTQQELGVKSKFYNKDLNRTGKELGQAFAKRHNPDETPGLAICIDVNPSSEEPLASTLREVIEKIIPSIYDGLTEESEYFRTKANSYRVILGGRNLARAVEAFSFDYKFLITYLKPFNYDVVNDIIGKYIPDTDKRAEFAANLLFTSGGHPRCMARILDLYSSEETPSPACFFSDQKEQIENIVYEEARWVRSSINENLQLIFDLLSVYRRLSYAILEKLSPRFSGTGEDVYDLTLKLKQSTFLDWADSRRRELKDGITRRLLNLRLYYDNPETFQQLSAEAHKIVEALIETETEPQLWLVESLFAFLQKNTSKISKRSERQALKKTFFNQELPRVLEKLSKGRKRMVELIALEGALELEMENEDEFRFIVNYYLRDKTYNEEPYQELETRIKEFAENQN